MKTKLLETARRHLLKSKVAYTQGDIETSAQHAVNSFNLAEYVDILTNEDEIKNLIVMVEKKLDNLEKTTIKIK